MTGACATPDANSDPLDDKVYTSSDGGRQAGTGGDKAHATRGSSGGNNMSIFGGSSSGYAGPTRAINTEMESCTWLDSVVWDENKPTKRPPLTQLILDLNDFNMIFEKDLSFENEEEEDEPEDVGDNIANKFLTKKDVKGLDDDDDEENEEEEDGADDRAEAIDERQMDLDPYNISNDYTDRYKKHINEKNIDREVDIQHSVPARNLYELWFPTILEPPLLARHHRFPLRLLRDSVLVHSHRYPVRLENKPHKITGNQPVYVKKAKQLSATEGSLLLIEYIEQYPPLLSNVGMGSLIVTYHRKKTMEEELKPPKPTIGRVQVLSKMDDSPFAMGDVLPGEPLQCVVNKLYTAPIFEQKVPTREHLFLLVFRKKRKTWTLRRLPPVFTAGQMQPKVEVCEPYTKKANDLVKERVRVYTRRFLLQHPDAIRKDVRQYQEEFKRKFHSELEVNNRLDLVVREEWKADGADAHDAVLQEMCSPEDVCVYESMAAGYHRLLRAGIPQVLAPSSRTIRKCSVKDLISICESIVMCAAAQARQTATNAKKGPNNSSAVTTSGSGPNTNSAAFIVPPQLRSTGAFDCKAIVNYIRMELELAPWTVTKSFLFFSHDRKQFDPKGFGNPLKQGYGVSFTVDYTDGKARDMSEFKAEDLEAKELIRQNTVGGVSGKSNDLRSLSMKQMAQLLEELGVPESIVSKTPRWGRVTLIADHAYQKVINGQDKALWARYARKAELTAPQRLEKHQNEVKEVFQKQCQLLQKGGLPEQKHGPDHLGPNDFSLIDQQLKIRS